MLARTQEIQREFVEEQQYNCNSLSTNNYHNILLFRHCVSCYKPIKGYTSRALITTFKIGYVQSGDSNLLCRWPCLSGSLPYHPCRQQIKTIISQHQRCFGDLSILDWFMLEIFQRKKFQSSKLRMFMCLANKILWYIWQFY